MPLALTPELLLLLLQVMPQLSFSPERAVAAQLDALLANDDPW